MLIKEIYMRTFVSFRELWMCYLRSHLHLITFRAAFNPTIYLNRFFRKKLPQHGVWQWSKLWPNFNSQVVKKSVSPPIVQSGLSALLSYSPRCPTQLNLVRKDEVESCEKMWLLIRSIRETSHLWDIKYNLYPNRTL